MSETRTEPNELSEAPVTTLGLADRLQPVLLIGSVAVGLGLAKFESSFAKNLGPLVSIGVVVLIFLVMLGLDVSRINRAFTQGRFLGVAIGINFVINPLIAWGLSEIFLSGQPNLQVGLILFLVTPCIGWYLIFTELAGGDTGLGVSLLGINLILQILLLPFYLIVFTGENTSVDLGGILASVALFLLMPAVAATVVRALAAKGGTELKKVHSFVDKTRLKMVALALIIVAMFASEGAVLFDSPDIVLSLLAPMVSFFAIAFLVALGIGRWVGLPFDQTALLVFTTTSRNSEASLAIAATAFASPLVSLTVVIGPVVELPLLIVMVNVLNRYSAKLTRSPS